MKLCTLLFAIAMMASSTSLIADEQVTIEITPHVNGKTYQTGRMIVPAGVPAKSEISSIAKLEVIASTADDDMIYLAIKGYVLVDGEAQVKVSPSMQVYQDKPASIKYETPDGTSVKFDVLASMIEITSK